MPNVEVYKEGLVRRTYEVRPAHSTQQAQGAVGNGSRPQSHKADNEPRYSRSRKQCYSDRLCTHRSCMLSHPHTWR